jgi:uncharacterized membrane protein
MRPHAAVTVLRPRDEVERLWHDLQHEHSYDDAAVRFEDAPGDHGTEVHVDLPDGGRFAGVLGKRVTRAMTLDDLRHFKQRVETGEVTRSQAAPEGESLARKLKLRPGQPQ